MKSEITYFENVGKINTLETIKIAYERFQKGDINKIVVSSTEGYTALEVIKVFKNMDAKIFVVGIDKNWDGKQRMSDEIQETIKSHGYIVYKGFMPFEFHRFTHDLSTKYFSDAIYTFSQGMKVCIEIILMCVSGELIQTGEKVLAIAGTHHGADTAIVATASSLYSFSRFEINEILCKPYNPRMKVEKVTKVNEI